MWIPVNKKTRLPQPAITDAEKNEWLKSEFYSSRFNFQAVPGSEKQVAPPPIEAKQAPQKSKEEEK